MADDRPACETDAENCGIEITPEMIEAGVSALLRFNRDFESEDSAVIRIYRTMREIEQENCPKP
jgi:hypothetical protein